MTAGRRLVDIYNGSRLIASRPPVWRYRPPTAAFAGPDELRAYPIDSDTSRDMAAEIAGVLDLFEQVAGEPKGIDDVVLLVRYILIVSDTPFETLKTALLDSLGEQVTKASMTGAERLREEGVNRAARDSCSCNWRLALAPCPGGAREVPGKCQGGAREVPGKCQGSDQRVSTADIARLDVWARRVLTAGDLDEVFAQAH